MSHINITYDDFVTLSKSLLEKVEPKKDEYKAILCPLRGGFFLSYFMSQRLQLPISYIEISSYAGKEQRGFQIGIKPEKITGKLLLCDDIYDSGKTIKKIHSMYPDVEFDTICLVSKVKDADIIYGKLIESEKWVDFYWEIM